MEENKPKLSIIIPTLNEEEGIAKTICMIPDKVREDAEIIVVDVSSDLTPVIAARLGARVLKEAKKGKGWQMRQAAKKSRGEILIFMDGDATDPGYYIPKLLAKLKTANLVLGCRSLEVTEDPKMRQYFKLWNVFSYPATQMLGLNVSDPLAGFRAIRRKDWDALDLKSDDFTIETEMNINAIRKQFVIAEVLIPNLQRAGGFQGSKFGRSPKMWYKIIKMLMDFSAETKKNVRER